METVCKGMPTHSYFLIYILTRSRVTRPQSLSEIRVFASSTRLRHCSLQEPNQHLPIALKRQLCPHHSQVPPTALQVTLTQPHLPTYSSCHMRLTRSMFHPTIQTPLHLRHHLRFLHHLSTRAPPPLKCIFAADQYKPYETQVRFSRRL